MNTRRPKEHYQIIITSGTDARKKPVSFSLTKRTIIFVFTFFLVMIAACLAVSLTAFGQAADSQKQIEALSQKIENQSNLLEDFASQLTYLQASAQERGSADTVQKTSPAAFSKTPALAAADVSKNETLGTLVWPLQSPDSGYDTEWPGPEG